MESFVHRVSNGVRKLLDLPLDYTYLEDHSCLYNPSNWWQDCIDVFRRCFQSRSIRNINVSSHDLDTARSNLGQEWGVLGRPGVSGKQEEILCSELNQPANDGFPNATNSANNEIRRLG